MSYFFTVSMREAQRPRPAFFVRSYGVIRDDF